jgi:uncharacterized membrane protein
MELKTNQSFKSVWIFCAMVLVAMFGLSAWAWLRLPAGASIPVHWNVAGEADGYGGKFEGLLLLPLVTNAWCRWARCRDPPH